ncbi:hypothetical protein DPMN_043857 [Dreissena polymorpha]|uniref:Uncharacterized protein n=1 Tax=Dreissena polymorpha TaxID=45954 RepID=A0A9D4HY82_DREPO|nr:hypothetical protein DPMN_043857 [Dreissena polymorpha]
MYDKDDTPNDQTNTHIHDANIDAVHYTTVQLSDDEYAEPYTRSETKQLECYSNDDKTSERHCKDNSSKQTPRIQEHIDHYDRTDVKREIQPFNEYNHLSTVHRHSQDALGDYDKTNITFCKINEGHDGDAETYNTAFSH